MHLIEEQVVGEGVDQVGSHTGHHLGQDDSLKREAVLETHGDRDCHPNRRPHGQQGGCHRRPRPAAPVHQAFPPLGQPEGHLSSHGHTAGEREAAEREDERWLVHRSSVSSSPSLDTWTNAEVRELRGRYDPGVGDGPEQVQASHISD